MIRVAHGSFGIVCCGLSLFGGIVLSSNVQGRGMSSGTVSLERVYAIIFMMFTFLQNNVVDRYLQPQHIGRGTRRSLDHSQEHG